MGDYGRISGQNHVRAHPVQGSAGCLEDVMSALSWMECLRVLSREGKIWFRF